MEFASRSVPGPLCQTNQKPPPLATGNCSLRSPTAPRQSSSLPDPGQASSTFTEGLIPSAQAHLVRSTRGSVVLPALPSQLLGHSSIQGVCAECSTQGRPGWGPSSTKLLSHLPAGPTSRISFSPFQNVGARHDLQETEGEALKGARIKMDRPPNLRNQGQTLP